GGTDLVVQLKEDVSKPAAVVDIKRIASLGGIKTKGNMLSIGALVTFTELVESPVIKNKFPVLWEAARSVASPGVRNRATMAGNICSAVPSLDSAPALLVYEAVVVVDGPKGQRKIPFAAFIAAPRRTTLLKGELVTAILLPLPKKHGGAYVKLGRYAGEDLAQAGVGVYADGSGALRVAFCALAPVPARSKKIEELLSGAQHSAALFAQAATLLEKELSPITDIRSSREYRLHMAGVMLERGVRAAYSRLAGAGPEYGKALV
ncbi:MAG TPA: xanthine dehydrogenase family protein subunit M, partial [Elusimicrobiales bacterium]|nr:xanthine dehydrogenase family protein subunit M [Elusimicrobiales bacterium]